MKSFSSNHRHRHLLLVSIITLMFVGINFFAVNPIRNTQAQSLGPFYGGLRLYTLECPCSVNFLVYIMDYVSFNVLALVYQPGASMLYSYFDIYGTYLTGDYTPGAGQCQIYVGTSCSQVTSDGQMGNLPGTGTSF